MEYIYLDHAASTPVHPDVVEAMLPYFSQAYGNPSSIHQFGRMVKTALDRARSTIAASLHAEPGQLVFTSGGTEADNMALFGVAMANREKGNHIITSSIEHHAVLHTCEQLEKLGFEITYLPVDEQGQIRIQDLQRAMKETTILVSIMYGNNEVGSLQPIHEIGQITREAGVYFHTDAVQAFGIIPLDMRVLPVDLLSISAHKINGPKGIGALYLAPNVKISPQIFGGAQEKKRRAGTENVPAIVGFAKAAEIAVDAMDVRREKYLALRESMISVWTREGVPFEVNGHPTEFLPHILNVSFPGVDTEVMLMNLDMAGVSCSSGSACASGSLEVSHVLKAMALQDHCLGSAIRFSFGLDNTQEQCRLAAEKVCEIIKRLTNR
ncbi:cysteine desulfurase family protein [Ammoniphilus sp. CFH 90114]|uniref:cysteine desulfurase family protein n=1 Tax=Ammoniphilus sp. CFH 90114 TaxID=2493665 RepID=UPI00100FDD05|nr:cysteine desulfurase family protein [Ammoniphilus sp. CFH 90114]RXT14767.1 cysteine desulfurase [Ammoniphilus sp. CFH 90114]